MNPEQQNVQKQKRNAAIEAAKHVTSGLIVGLGSGSTAAMAIEEIGNKIKREKLQILAIPTSYQAFMLAAKHHIPMTTLEEHPILDITIDGADQIDPELNLIKGMGGALAREKILAYSSKKNIVVADEGKLVKTLGEGNQPVPIEVMVTAIPLVVRKLKTLGGQPVVRESGGKVGPVVTDNGNFIVDTEFGLISNPRELDCGLKTIPGIIETGIFTGTANLAYVGKRSSVEKLVKG